MVRNSPTSMLRVVVAFTVTAVVAVVPVAIMLAASVPGYGEWAVVVLTAAAAVSVAALVAGTSRRLRPVRA